MTNETESIRTSFSRARGLGAGHSGVKHWRALRTLSLPLIPLSFYFLLHVDALTTSSRMGFIAWAGEPVAAFALIVFIICAFYHACLGMEEIMLDYIQPEGAKVAALLANKMFFAGLGIASLYAVLAISFGSFKNEKRLSHHRA